VLYHFEERDVIREIVANFCIDALVEQVAVMQVDFNGVELFNSETIDSDVFWLVLHSTFDFHGRVENLVR